MNYAQQQRDPTRHVIGIGSVILLHIVIVWALLTGLASRVVEVIKRPLDVKVIEEVIKKPPPPPEIAPPPPKLAAPPPPFIPPPEVNVAPPPVPVQTIAVVTQETPPAPQAPVIAKIDPTPAPPPPPPAPAVRSVNVACPNAQQVRATITYPREALLDNIEGEVLLEITIDPSGKVKDVAILKSANRVFNKAVVAAARQLSCTPQAQETKVTWPIGFKLDK